MYTPPGFTPSRILLVLTCLKLLMLLAAALFFSFMSSAPFFLLFLTLSILLRCFLYHVSDICQSKLAVFDIHQPPPSSTAESHVSQSRSVSLLTTSIICFLLLSLSLVNSLSLVALTQARSQEFMIGRHQPSVGSTPPVKRSLL
jgi:hypothetical protein